MSMHSYPEHGFGLMLNEEETKAFCKRYNEAKNEECDCYDIQFAFDGCRYYSNDCDGRYFYYSTNKNVDNEGATGLFFFADWQPNAFRVAYYSMDDCVKEFTDKIGEYLPEDFNYEDHIGYFEAVVCG